MELGISMFADLAFNPANDHFQHPKQRLQELLAEIRLADEVGLDVFGLGEHHRNDYAVSSPSTVLAAAASVTKNIKLSSAVTVLSSEDPVRVFQQFSTIDLLSDGRAEIMAGRGSFTESFPLFGYRLEDYDTLFTEKLELLLKINSNTKPIDWSGTHTPPLRQQHVYPRPEKPLNIWIAAGGTPESVARAARLGLPLIIAIIGGVPKQFAPLFDYYKQEYLRAGHDPAKLRIATHAHGLVGDSGKVLAQNYFSNYKRQMDHIGRTRGWSPYTPEQYDAGRSREGALFIGNTQQIVEKILYHHEMFGLTRWLMHMDVGAPDHRTLMRSIELFGTKVAPEVRKALGL